MQQQWGGKRPNSGRPIGSGRYGTKTKAIRVPENLVVRVMEYIASKGFEIPLYSSKVKAGFPSPSDDYIEDKLDLNNYLIKHPASTFLVRASGNSMVGAGICDNALLIVDRSIEPCHGKIVIAVLNGELTVKRFKKTTKGCFLVAENPDYPPIAINDNDEVHIWGVVIHVINSM